MISEEIMASIEEDAMSNELKHHQSGRRNRLIEYYENPNKCQHCNKIIMIPFKAKISSIKEKKFCDHSCAASFNNKFTKISDKETFAVGTPCPNCGKPTKSKNKYCNNQCQMDYQYKQYIIRWKSGEELGLIGEYQTSDHIKRYLLEKYNNKCSVCGWNKVNQYTNKIPLELEHIDGNYLNNKEENLTILCPNCHSLTSTYKGANIGNGRKGRKKYS